MLALGGAELWGEWSEFPGWVAMVPEVDGDSVAVDGEG